MAAASKISVFSAETQTLSDETLRKIAALWTSAFPTPPTRDRFAEAAARRDGRDAAATREKIHYVLAADGTCLAAARSFRREVDVGGRPIIVLALAHVATSPAARGRGLGAAVVRSAWARLGRDGVEECVFCTGVPDFYAKLGARKLAARDVVYPAGAKRFVDPSLFRVATAAAADWPDGALDVRGDGW